MDSLAAPVTPFTVDRAQSAKAIEESQSGYSALNLEQALSFAQQALSWSGGTSGEIVYIGPRMNADDPSNLASPNNLRTISIDADRNNVGIRRMGVKRNEDDPNAWQATDNP